MLVKLSLLNSEVLTCGKLPASCADKVKVNHKILKHCTGPILTRDSRELGPCLKMRSSVESISNTWHTRQRGATVRAESSFLTFSLFLSFSCLRGVTFVLTSPVHSLILCVTVSLPGYICCSPPSAEIDQRIDVLFTRRAVLALTWILHQSLNTFRASCKTWQGENQTGANPAAAAAAECGLESAEYHLYTIFFVVEVWVGRLVSLKKVNRRVN